ncbi:MAG TPA: hypothetical protein VNZ44_01450, partial [Pyrinomonadaceae bacterium]|nr:hypothetical protein [Pyrinomonadaceae bacterium]
MNFNPAKSHVKTLLAALLLVLGARAASAQGTLKVKNALRGYELTVNVSRCDDEGQTCGPAVIRVYRKGEASPLQSLRLPSVEIHGDTVEHNDETGDNPRGLYAEEYSFVGGDYNFDGHEDLAVCNGREGGYGGPS